MKKVFVLGVGTQKAGTTWLHSYLNSYDFSNFGVLKEYHIWDAMRSPLCDGWRVNTNDLVTFKRMIKPVPEETSILRYAMQNIAGVYEGFFSGLCDVEHWLTGDITPSYCMLKEADFVEIKRRLEHVGFKVKVVFLLRDPFERCWSSIRMRRRNDPKRKTKRTEENDLKRLYKADGFVRRTQYDAIIRELEKVFSAQEIVYGLFEQLFEPSEVKRICDFLGVPLNEPLLDSKINASPKDDHISINLKNEIIGFYRGVYEYCHERFPETRTLWHKLDPCSDDC